MLVNMLIKELNINKNLIYRTYEKNENWLIIKKMDNFKKTQESN